jgi:hypothetical protein
MITRREAIRVLGTTSVGAWLAAQTGLSFAIPPKPHTPAAKDDQIPALTPESPMSPQRIALIAAFKKQRQGSGRGL